MTPLMCAAYKGKTEMCELLMAQGADINSNYHEHQVGQKYFQYHLYVIHVTVGNKCIEQTVPH